MAVDVPNVDVSGLWRTFFLSISLIILVFVLGIFLGMFFQNKDLIEGELLTRARSHFDNIVLTRAWNAGYGGVYVEKTQGVESNPYLEDPDITTVDGRVFTMKNPALMTREISEMAAQKGDFHFHITSLNLLNPDNTPDHFEENALKAFENGGTNEVFEKEVVGTDTFFRYMAPLIATKACLECHSRQGYEVGQVRGGISVRFNINDVERALTVNGIITAALFVGTVASMLGLIYLFVYKLTRKIAAAEQRIREMAVTDELTGLFNRRVFRDRLTEESERSKRYNRPLSCIMFDVDHFKNVNDTHGHDVGDVVLRMIGNLLSEHSRTSDCVARYGGEEFVHILPETGADEAAGVAEKLRALIAEQTIETGNGPLQVTSSFGVASFSADDIRQTPDIDTIVKVADEALYKAKNGGRNRVELAVGAAG